MAASSSDAEAAAGASIDTIDGLSNLTVAEEATLESVLTVSEPEARWLEAFWFSTYRRKNPGGEASLQELASGDRRVLLQARAESGCSSAQFSEQWTKAAVTALKKVEVEDLGAMDAAHLWETIPEVDSSGRGRADLAGLENELQVKAVFCIGTPEEHGKKAHGHVFLVGAKTKLAKKAFVIRNLLSHYHWRLSGRDVAFEEMVKK